MLFALKEAFTLLMKFKQALAGWALHFGDSSSMELFQIWFLLLNQWVMVIQLAQ